MMNRWAWLLLLFPLLFRGPRIFLLAGFGIVTLVGIAFLAVAMRLLGSLVPRSIIRGAGSLPRSRPEPGSASRAESGRGSSAKETEARPYDPAAVVDARFEEVE